MDSNPLYLIGNTHTSAASVRRLTGRPFSRFRLILPPGYKAEQPRDKQGFKAYPLSKAKQPPKMEFISGSKRPINTIHANDFEFYQEIDHVIGEGSQYGIAFADSSGQPFDSANSYKLNIPASVPAKNFRSVVLYDPQTRSELQTSQPFPSKNNQRDKLVTNADASVDLYFSREHLPSRRPTGSPPCRKRAGSSASACTVRSNLGSIRPGGQAKSL